MTYGFSSLSWQGHNMREWEIYGWITLIDRYQYHMLNRSMRSKALSGTETLCCQLWNHHFNLLVLNLDFLLILHIILGLILCSIFTFIFIIGCFHNVCNIVKPFNSCCKNEQMFHVFYKLPTMI